MTCSNRIWSLKVALSRFWMCLERVSENCQFFEGLFSSKNNHFVINFHVNSLILCRNIILSSFLLIYTRLLGHSAQKCHFCHFQPCSLMDMVMFIAKIFHALYICYFFMHKFNKNDVLLRDFVGL